MLHDAHAAGVASASDHAHVADLELDGLDGLAALQVNLDGVVNLNQPTKVAVRGKTEENFRTSERTKELGVTPQVKKKTGKWSQTYYARTATIDYMNIVRSWYRCLCLRRMLAILVQ